MLQPSLSTEMTDADSWAGLWGKCNVQSFVKGEKETNKQEYFWAETS